MPRAAGASVGGLCYHGLNRGNARTDLFHDADDDQAFLELVQERLAERPMRILAYSRFK